MSAVSNVSHRQSHKRQQPSQANYWGRGAAESGRLCEHPRSGLSTEAFVLRGRSTSRGEERRGDGVGGWQGGTGSPERQWPSSGHPLPLRPLNFPTVSYENKGEEATLRAEGSLDSFAPKPSGPETKKLTKATESRSGKALVNTRAHTRVHEHARAHTRTHHSRTTHKHLETWALARYGPLNIRNNCGGWL